jgi:hypothetical protein
MTPIVQCVYDSIARKWNTKLMTYPSVTVALEVMYPSSLCPMQDTFWRVYCKIERIDKALL